MFETACKYQHNEPKVGILLKRVEYIGSIGKYLAVKNQHTLNQKWSFDISDPEYIYSTTNASIYIH